MEQRELESKIFELILEQMEPYETPGQSAHERAARIADETTIQVVTWIAVQTQRKLLRDISEKLTIKKREI